MVANIGNLISASAAAGGGGTPSVGSNFASIFGNFDPIAAAGLVGNLFGVLGPVLQLFGTTRKVGRKMENWEQDVRKVESLFHFLDEVKLPTRQPPGGSSSGVPAGSSFGVGNPYPPNEGTSWDPRPRPAFDPYPPRNLPSYGLDLPQWPTGLYSTPLEQATIRFQRKKGLTADGLIAPEGETLNAIRREFFSRPELIDRVRRDPMARAIALDDSMLWEPRAQEHDTRSNSRSTADGMGFSTVSGGGYFAPSQWLSNPALRNR